MMISSDSPCRCTSTEGGIYGGTVSICVQKNSFGVPQLNSRFSVPSPCGASGVTTGNLSSLFPEVRKRPARRSDRVLSLDEEESTLRISRKRSKSPVVISSVF